MTAQDLADACEELGYPIPRNVIANWESGRRLTLTVPELLVLARAVDMPPAALVFPLGGSSSVEYLPSESADPWTAFSWFVGEDVDHLTGDVALFRTHARREKDLRASHHDAWQLQFLPEREAWPPGSDAKFDLLVQAVRSELLPIRTQLREWDLTPPPLPTYLAFLDQEAGPTNNTQEGTP